MINQQVTAEAIFKKIAREKRIPLKDVKQIGDEIFAEIKASLLTQREVKLPFGTFQLVFQPPEMHRNVRAQKVVRYGPGWKTNFVPTSTFRDELRGPKEEVNDPDLYFRLVESSSRVGMDMDAEEAEA